MRSVLMLAGIVAVLVGALWIGQGTGYVHWPQTSFMINDMKWTWIGAVLALVGLILIFRARGGRDMRSRMR